jgi:hypothetical protein
MRLPSQASLKSAEPLKCGELPFPGVILQSYDVTRCWYVFYVHHHRDIAFSVISGTDPHDHHHGFLLYNTVNGPIFIVGTPATGHAPSIHAIKVPFVYLDYRGSTRTSAYNLATGRFPS